MGPPVRPLLSSTGRCVNEAAIGSIETHGFWQITVLPNNTAHVSVNQRAQIPCVKLLERRNKFLRGFTQSASSVSSFHLSSLLLKLISANYSFGFYA